MDKMNSQSQWEVYHWLGESCSDVERQWLSTGMQQWWLQGGRVGAGAHLRLSVQQNTGKLWEQVISHPTKRQWDTVSTSFSLPWSNICQESAWGKQGAFGLMIGGYSSLWWVYQSLSWYYDITPWPKKATYGRQGLFRFVVPKEESAMLGEAWQQVAGAGSWPLTFPSTCKNQLEVGEG